MKTSKELRLILSRVFPRIPEDDKKEKVLKSLEAETATARDFYILARLLEHHIEYQDALIGWLCRELIKVGVPIGPARARPSPTPQGTPPPNAEDGGASWVMAGLNPDDKSPSPDQQASGPPDGGAAWVMQGVEDDGPSPSTGQPPTAPQSSPPTNGGGIAAPVPTPQTLPNVQASGAPVPNDIQAMFAKQAVEMDKNKLAGT